MKLTLAELTGGKEAVLANVANDPAFKAERFKGPGMLAQRAAEIASQIARGNLTQLVGPSLEAAYNSFVGLNGPRPAEPGLAQDEWESALDDEIAAVFEPYTKVLSADWLGQKTVDTRAYEEGEIDRLAASFAKEAWRMLTYDGEARGQRTTNQLLAGVGIVADDIAEFLHSLTQPQDMQPVFTLEPDMALNATLNKIMLFVADNKAARGDIGLVASDETDEFILPQAMARLGIDNDDVDNVRLAMLSGHSIDTLATLVERGEILDEGPDVEPFDTATGELYGTSPALAPGGDLDQLRAQNAAAAAALAPALPPPAPGTSASPLPPAKRGRKPRGDTGPKEGQVPAGVLTAFKDNANIKDEDVATALGLARATFNNFVRGKQPFVPTEQQRATLRGIVVGKVNGLLTALSTYDNQPYETLE